jgi:chorismate synthase
MLGTLFTVTTFGESHGPAIGCVIDGCPPGMELSEADIQPDLDRWKPGTSRHVTQRREDDLVEILSGVYEGKTTGTPIALLIRNVDQRSKDYAKIADSFRPGHADYTYLSKYGIRDPRGRGRSSARLTAPAVAAGAIARKWLRQRYGVKVRGDLSQSAPTKSTSNHGTMLTAILFSSQTDPACPNSKRIWTSFVNRGSLSAPALL